jgi:hypothetical protein
MRALGDAPQRTLLIAASGTGTEADSELICFHGRFASNGKLRSKHLCVEWLHTAVGR